MQKFTDVFVLFSFAQPLPEINLLSLLKKKLGQTSIYLPSYPFIWAFGKNTNLDV
jgi:hypothetical protein